MNFDSIRGLVAGEKSPVLLNFSSIRRTNYHTVVARLESKTSKPAYGKRRFVNLRESYPHGYSA